MNSDIAVHFHNSLNRCEQKSGFLERFYEIFINSSPIIKEKFKNTDFKRQRRMLYLSLFLIYTAAMDGHVSEYDEHFERIAKIHSRKGVNIPPALYDLWLECLLQTVKEYDHMYSSDVEEAWRISLNKGIEFMQSKY